MTPLSDLLQTLLSQPGALGLVCCTLLFGLTWIAYRYAKAVLRWSLKLFREVRRPFIPLKWGSAFWVCFGGWSLWLANTPVSDALQWVEQRYLTPAYVQSDTAQWVEDIYVWELSKHLYPSELEVITRRTREIADKIGSKPLYLYQVYHAETGCNPFIIRADGIAAGLVQFTTNGLRGLDTTLDDVKQACKRRDTDFIMNLTERYFLTRHKGVPLNSPEQVYVAVFAPGYCGADCSQALYRKEQGACYELNQGLDGFYTETINGKELIMNSRSKRDGIITVNDLRLCLEMKKAKLIQQSMR